jgi:formamidopyrimidine-DNA glycosylase
VVWSPDAQAQPALKLLGHLGVEPFSPAFTVDHLRQGLAARRAPVKQVLMAGDIVVGVGNIYASEALFLAGIRPTRAANAVRPREVARLHEAIVQVLARAVREGGSSLRDFQSPEGVNGHYQHEAHVYGRAGQPCRVCGHAVRMIRQGQRSSFYCPKCQK